VNNADARQELKGRTVVVTGASSGIGAAAARRFADRGATVAVVGRSPHKTAADAIGGQAHLADYGRLADVRRLAQELLNRTDKTRAGDQARNPGTGTRPDAQRNAKGSKSGSGSPHRVPQVSVWPAPSRGSGHPRREHFDACQVKLLNSRM
jgi:NAD(P)-dependent dehydrogenase (short-subunit alcohol dehydrogenase family)